jgi:hypothetical protein
MKKWTSLVLALVLVCAGIILRVYEKTDGKSAENKY